MKYYYVIGIIVFIILTSYQYSLNKIIKLLNEINNNLKILRDRQM